MIDERLSPSETEIEPETDWEQKTYDLMPDLISDDPVKFRDWLYQNSGFIGNDLRYKNACLLLIDEYQDFVEERYS